MTPRWLDITMKVMGVAGAASALAFAVVIAFAAAKTVGSEIPTRTYFIAATLIAAALAIGILASHDDARL